MPIYIHTHIDMLTPTRISIITSNGVNKRTYSVTTAFAEGNSSFTNYFKFSLSTLHHNIKEKIWFGLIWFYGISTFVGYLTPNLFLCK